MPIHATAWMTPEHIMLCGLSQTRNDQYGMTPFLRGPRVGKCVEVGSGLALPVRRGAGEPVFTGNRVSVWEDGKVLDVKRSNGCTPMGKVLSATERYT